MNNSNVDDRYSPYDKLKPSIDKIAKSVRGNRYFDYQVIGKSVEGRDMHFVILAKDKVSADQYLNDTLPNMLTDPDKFQHFISDRRVGIIKVPILLNNIHPDEPPAVDAILTLLRLFATRDSVSYKPADNKNETTIKIDEALNHIIFLFNFTANPDGLHYNTRKNANGFDLNRDNAYQTQPESEILIQQIVKWNPICLLDFHGYIKSLLIEPGTPPHDPNCEYDLLMDGMLPQARLMGNAVTANTKYESYTIPLLDRSNGWDDVSPRDLTSYVLLHGIMGHCIEIPEFSRQSHDALVYAALASAKYVIDNKQKLFINQLECFRRGVEGIDSREVDKYLTDATGKAVGRPRGNYENFFPEYYVLPVEKKLQRNPLEAYNAVYYLLRNGIKVCKTIKDIMIGDVLYSKGAYVVPMRQAKRGYVNSVLYSGMDVSDFKKMHALMMMNFPALRGFDVYPVRVTRIFDGTVEEVISITIPSTSAIADSKEIIIKNSNNHAVKAVNRLLSDNKAVKILIENGIGYKAGDYLVSKEDFSTIKDFYLLDASSYHGNSLVRTLTQPKVANVGTEQTTFVLKELGFSMVKDVNDCDVIVDDHGYAKKEDIEKGRHYIGIGGYALNFIKKSKLLPGFNYSKTSYSHEGLLRAEMDASNLITAGYEREELLYFANGSWIEKAPVQAKVFAIVSNNENFFISGWWPGHEAVKGKILGFTHKAGNSNITLFAPDITKNAHPQNSFRLLANAIFLSALN